MNDKEMFYKDLLKRYLKNKLKNLTFMFKS